MTPLPKLSASRSRSEFFRHLGLSENNERDKRLYQMMMVRYTVVLRRGLYDSDSQFRKRQQLVGLGLAKMRIT